MSNAFNSEATITYAETVEVLMVKITRCYMKETHSMGKKETIDAVVGALAVPDAPRLGCKS